MFDMIYSLIQDNHFLNIIISLLVDGEYTGELMNGSFCDEIEREGEGGRRRERGGGKKRERRMEGRREGGREGEGGRERERERKEGMGS